MTISWPTTALTLQAKPNLLMVITFCQFPAHLMP